MVYQTIRIFQYYQLQESISEIKEVYSNLNGKWTGTYEQFNYYLDTTKNHDNLAILLNGTIDSSSVNNNEWKANKTIDQIAITFSIDFFGSSNIISINIKNKTRTYPLELHHAIKDFKPNELSLAIGQADSMSFSNFNIHKLEYDLENLLEKDHFTLKVKEFTNDKIILYSAGGNQVMLHKIKD